MYGSAMRRIAPVLLAAVLAGSLFGVAGCSSNSSSSTSDGNVSTPDGSFCSLLVAFRTSNDSLDGEVNSGDSNRAKAAVTRLVSQADLLRKKATPDIKADVDAVAVYVTSLDRLFAQSGYDIDAIVKNEAASAEFLALTSDSVDSSLLQLRTYAETVCAAGSGSATTTTVAP